MRWRAISEAICRQEGSPSRIALSRIPQLNPDVVTLTQGFGSVKSGTYLKAKFIFGDAQGPGSRFQAYFEFFLALRV